MVSAESHFYAQTVLDFSSTNASASDVVEAIKILARTFVHTVIVEVITAEGGTATADVGDGADPNGWHDAVDLNSAGFTHGDGAFTAAPIGKLYTADDTIDLTLDHDLDACQVRVTAIGVYLPNVQADPS